MRTYVGFRPATPDRLPIVGPDPAIAGLLHATGHEGAGVGLAEVTGEAIEDLVLGRPAGLDLAPFSPARFAAGVAT
jgi:glycine/D-amino acid oxidase-like deaminating enzyme